MKFICNAHHGFLGFSKCKLEADVYHTFWGSAAPLEKVCPKGHVQLLTPVEYEQVFAMQVNGQ